MKTQDEKNQTISIKVSRADYKILQQIKQDKNIPSMAKVINGLLSNAVDDEYELVLSRVFSGAVLKKMNQGMTKVAAEAEAKVLVDGLR